MIVASDNMMKIARFEKTGIQICEDRSSEVSHLKECGLPQKISRCILRSDFLTVGLDEEA